MENRSVTPATANQDPLLDVAALCRRLALCKGSDCKHHAVYSLTRSRNQHGSHPLPVIRISARHMVVRESSLLHWLEELEKQPAPTYKPRPKARRPRKVR